MRRFALLIAACLLLTVSPTAAQTDPLPAALDALTALHNRLATSDAACRGLVFEQQNATVHGPLTIPPGTYRVTATTPGYFIADLQPLSGECDTPDYGNLFILSDGRAADGAQTIITSSGCTAIITTSNITDPYTLTISPLAP